MATATIPVRLMPDNRRFDIRQSDFAEIAPGIFGASCPPSLSPRVAVARMRHVKDNLWEPIIQVMPTLVRRKDWIEKLYGCSFYSAVRLAFAGFVLWEKPTPRTTAIILESYFDHLKTVKDDPYFWTPERCQRYEDAKQEAAAAASEPDEPGINPDPADQPGLFDDPRP